MKIGMIGSIALASIVLVGCGKKDENAATQIEGGFGGE